MTPRPPRPKLPWDEIYPTLDLHGHTAQEAWSRARRWFAERRAAGERTVRIITGRGLHSVGPPVLRGEIEALLSEMRTSGVRRWEWEPGGGVVRVELTRPASSSRTPAAPQPAPSAAPPPELLRAAYDTLAELGITPTPELLAAEVRRLRRERREG